MVMSLGLGAVMSGSWRQKLNTGSSTEAELVGIDDALKYIMWGLYFIQAQGFEVKRMFLCKTTSRPFSWHLTEGSHAPSAPSISRIDIS